MLQAQLDDRERVSKLEGRQNVSEQFVNTSIGFTSMPHIYEANSYVECTMQGNPVYTTARVQNAAATSIHAEGNINHYIAGNQHACDTASYAA
jgi:hypothetical protein